MKRLITVLVIMGLLAGAIAVPVAASNGEDPDPEGALGRCPPNKGAMSWELVPDSNTGKDHNGDGYVCKGVPQPPHKKAVKKDTVIIDNNLPLP